MMSDFKLKFKQLYEKIKKVKHIEIYLACGLAVIVALIYFGSVATAQKANSDSSTNKDNVTSKFLTSQEYVYYIENKLENVLTKLKGAGDVEVLVTLEKGFEYVYVTEEESKTTSNGTIVTTKTVVMVDGQPVLQEEIYPIVKGIVVVSEGAEDVSVKLNMISVIQTVIEIDNSKINIVEGN